MAGQTIQIVHLTIFWFRQEIGEEFTFVDGQEARRSRRRTENVRLSPKIPRFTMTKVSTGGLEVTSEDREREAES